MRLGRVDVQYVLELGEAHVEARGAVVRTERLVLLGMGEVGERAGDARVPVCRYCSGPMSGPTPVEGQEYIHTYICMYICMYDVCVCWGARTW